MCVYILILQSDYYQCLQSDSYCDSFAFTLNIMKHCPYFYLELDYYREIL